MTTLEIQLNDDLHAFVLLQSRVRGHASPDAYIESLLAVDRLRNRAPQVDALLHAAKADKTLPVDEAYWHSLEAEIFPDAATDSAS